MCVNDMYLHTYIECDGSNRIETASKGLQW